MSEHLNTTVAEILCDGFLQTTRPEANGMDGAIQKRPSMCQMRPSMCQKRLRCVKRDLVCVTRPEANGMQGAIHVSSSSSYDMHVSSSSYDNACILLLI
jgi:hypothetical protein